MSPSDNHEDPQIIYRNTALVSFLETPRTSPLSFETWSNSLARASLRQPIAATAGEARHAGVFGDREWSSKSLKCGWTIVYCRKHNWNTSAHQSKAEQSTSAYYTGTIEYEDAAAETDIPLSQLHIDWLKYPLLSSDPWISYLRGFNWSSTKLGPTNEWSSTLCSYVITIMACHEPRYIFWGDDLIMLYNEAAVPILGPIHPGSLGKPLADIWGKTLHDQHQRTIRHGIQQGKAFPIKAAELIVERNGFYDELYSDIQYTPIPSEDGRWSGSLLEYHDVTPRIYQENRKKVAAAISNCTARMQSLAGFWVESTKVLEAESKDVSYAVIYSVNSRTSAESPPYQFEASYGTDSSLFKDEPPLSLANAFSTNQGSLHLLQKSTQTLPPELTMTTAHGTVSSAYIMPVTSGIGAELAYVILGMNPRRAAEESHLFVTHLRDLFERSCAIIDLPEARKRLEEANLALLDQLRITKVKAEKNEEAFKRMGRQAPAGMFIFAADGRPLYANEAYLNLFDLSNSKFYDDAQTDFVWGAALYEEDHQSAKDLMIKVFRDKQTGSFEYRLRSGSQTIPRWMEGTIFPETDDAGNVVSFQGWVADISHRKFAEHVREERLQEALDHKRAAEKFLDMISHEIRNPLSSILLLAEDILMSLPQDKNVVLPPENTDSIIDAAKTISLCAVHQKSIVDEVLTISKLDSNLLVLSLEKARALSIVESGLKMLSADLSAANIEKSVNVLPSYEGLGLDDILLDVHRMTQVFINLLNNAIKFTRDSEKRRITVTIGGSTERPAAGSSPVTFIPCRMKQSGSLISRVKQSAAVEAGREIYIHFSVEDTGCGLTGSEMSHLFHRFSQASPKTYKQYGGSGLGLFISRELVELHGGQVGVRSSPGVGSNFMFYIQAYRAKSASALETVVRASDVKAVSEANTPLKKGSLSLSNGKESSLKDMHVLLVEDNPVNQKVIAKQLRRAGCKTVKVAEHGVEALDFLSKSSLYKDPGVDQIPLSVILLDVEMPVMDGLTCIRRIRELEGSGDIIQHVPVIAITANARQQQIDDALQAGMDSVETKPFNIPDLVSRMEALVAKWQPS
ncbi:hypothetical protein AAFC00_002503 [Neodothiora populina]